MLATTTEMLQKQIIKSLPELREAILHIPPEVVEAAIEANPWFTPYYIQVSLESIANWMTEEAMAHFIHHNPYLTAHTKRIGIIMAGNLPLVGFHDVLMTLLAGHIAVCKPSHQDTVLIEWLINEWERIEPLVGKLTEITVKPLDIDYLVATGSDNSARYFEWNYKKIPCLIRKNRYSVAVISNETTEDDIKKLGLDIFLHNGFGCRNVSNILIRGSFVIENCIKIWKNMDFQQFNFLYISRLKRLRAELTLLNIPYLDGGFFLAKKEKTINSSPPGIIRFIEYQGVEELNSILIQANERIQCIVGKNVCFGKSQFPNIGDFPDGINTIKTLSHI